MKKTRRLIALILGVVFCLGILAACNTNTHPGGGGGGGSTPVAPPNPGAPAAPSGGGQGDLGQTQAQEGAKLADEVRIIQDNNMIGVLNPFSPAANTTPTNWIFSAIYDRLISTAEDGFTLIPELALTFSTTDYKTYSFTLREDVNFHNGEKFTAKDVEWTMKQAQAGIGSTSFDQWRPVQSINIKGDYAFDIVLNAVNVDFLFGLTRPAAGILNQKAMDADSEKGTWVGTGAYKVLDFQTNDFTYLERNPNWWNKDNPVVTERIHMSFIPEMGTRSIMLQNNDVQLSFGTSAEDIAIFEADPANYTVHPLVFADPQGLNFNMTHPLTSDYNFRMAVLHALDRVEIAFVAAGKWADGGLKDGTFWGLVTEHRKSDIPLPEYNVELAKEYLAKSPYKAGDVVEIATAIITNQRASEAIQAQLADVGITSEINFMDPPSMNSYIINGTGMINVFFTTMTPNAGSIRNAYYPGSSQNRSLFNDQYISDLLDEAAAETNANRRRDIYYEIQDYMAGINPTTCLFWRVNGIVWHNNLGGVILRSDLARIDLRWIYLEID
jgi:peptide/nickel transport system substrate-binding protein